jgi:hypothetical protein
MGVNTHAGEKNARFFVRENGKRRPGRGLARNHLAPFRNIRRNSVRIGAGRRRSGELGANRCDP